MADQQQQKVENPLKKLMIVKLPDNVDTIPVSLRNLTLPSVIINSNHVDFDSMKQKIVEDNCSTSSKRQKKDLICVICLGNASGYNFNRITCHSCKEFFRRNALQPIEKLKCLTDRFECSIRFDLKTKCSRCRLKKCFDFGMRKDFLMTSEQKLIKQKRIEDNRRLRLTSTSQINETIVTSILTDEHRKHLEEIEQIYRSVLQTSPSPSTIFSFEKTPDEKSAFIHTMNIDNLIAIRVIHFVRSIKDFTSLEEQDRFTLVKYNLTSVCSMEYSLSFNLGEIYCHFETPLPNQTVNEEEFFRYSFDQYKICYGEESVAYFVAFNESMSKIVGKDGRLILVSMLMMLFLKGWSIYEDQAPILIDHQRVFAAQSKYTELFFRCLLEKNSFDIAVKKMTQFVGNLLHMQKLSLEFDPFVRSFAERININPLMKSLLHLS